MEALFEALKSRDPEVVRPLLHPGVDLRGVKTPEGDAIIAACMPSSVWSEDDVEVLRLVLAAGADPDGADRWGDRKLTSWAYFGMGDAVRMLLDAGADPEGTDNADGHTLLHGAVAGGLLELARELLEAGADVDAPCKWGHTALQYAVDASRWRRSDTPKRWRPMAELVLAAGAEVNAMNHNGDWGSALHWAAARGTSEAVTLLLEAGADLHAATPKNAEQPIHQAAMGSDPGIVAALLAAGADPNAPDSAGWTPLHFVGRGRDQQIARLLLDAGADPRAISHASRQISSGRYGKKKRPADIAKRHRDQTLMALLKP